MAEKKVTIWTLNCAEDLIQGKEDAIKAIFESYFLERLFGKEHIECEFGNREKYNENSAPEDSRKLMYEQPDFNEYFVPISLKCIGSLRNATGLKGEGQPVLEAIKEEYDYLFNDSNFDSYWTEGHGPNNRTRMKTKKRMGYYEIL